MTRGQPPTSPWLFYDSGGDFQGRHITGTATFSGVLTGTDPTAWTNALTGGTVHRDAGCAYTKLIIGPLNPDGSPAAGAKVIDVSGLSGDRSFSAAQLAAVGLSTVADIANAPQITASP